MDDELDHADILAIPAEAMSKSNVIRFTMPELSGCQLYICGDRYQLYAGEERLTDTFLDTLIHYYKTDNPAFTYTLYGELQCQTPVTFHFSNKQILIEQNGFQKTYPVPFQDFCEAYFQNV